MPTGYTAKLCENGQSFRDFVFTCARAMGACIALRDEPLSADLPDNVGFNSSYHEKALADARADLAKLTSMPAAEREAYGAEKKAETLRRYAEHKAKDEAVNARIDAMTAEVLEWTPPTSEHEGLKRFMLQQLETSREPVDYWDNEIKKTEAKEAIEFFSDAVGGTRRSLEYHIAAAAKDKDRDDGRNEWVRQLKASVADSATTAA